MLEGSLDQVKCQVTGCRCTRVVTHLRCPNAHYLLEPILEQLGDRQGAVFEYRELMLAQGYAPAQNALTKLNGR